MRELVAIAVGNAARPSRRGAAHQGGQRRPRGRHRLPREARHARRAGRGARRDPRAQRRRAADEAEREVLAAYELGARGTRTSGRCCSRSSPRTAPGTLQPCRSCPRSRAFAARWRRRSRGGRFEQVEISDPRLTRPLEPLEVAAELAGERVSLVDRRGKYLIVRFESGRALLVHLRMTGSFLLTPEGIADPHRRAVVSLDDGSDVAYRDVRRFGTWLLLEPDEVEAYLETRVGREPLGDALQVEASRREARRAQGAGQGGDPRPAHGGRRREHLRRRGALAGAHPSTDAGRGARRGRGEGALPRHPGRAPGGDPAPGLDATRLPAAGRRPGRAQHEFKVYGRGGEPCDRCGTPIDKIRVAGRGTWFCPSCQRLRYAPTSSASRPSRSRRQSSS